MNKYYEYYKLIFIIQKKIILSQNSLLSKMFMNNIKEKKHMLRNSNIIFKILQKCSFKDFFLSHFVDLKILR